MENSASPSVPTTPAPAPHGASSAQRLIATIQRLNDFDVARSTVEDQEAVRELIELTAEEHRNALLIALLLERIREDDGV